METSTPVFPNGRVGTILSRGTVAEALAWDSLNALKGISDAPKPPAPADLINSLLENALFFRDMLIFSS
jgi:hypothetical protein